jgi:hypothetical protein
MIIRHPGAWFSSLSRRAGGDSNRGNAAQLGL